jgi:protein-L-isoaspartate(D-aspartate) O-methyltransferase
VEAEGQINNGQPTLHALCLMTLSVKEGETAVHVGAGTGYYTAVLARLAGPAGAVFGYEIEERLA